MITLRRYGAIWLDEDNVQYGWLDDCQCFVSNENYKYYMVKERIDDDNTTVVLAQCTPVIEIFQENYDMTFLMEETIIDGELRSSEVISWYYGKPNPEDTAYFSKERKLIAKYD